MDAAGAGRAGRWDGIRSGGESACVVFEPVLQPGPDPALHPTAEEAQAAGRAAAASPWATRQSQLMPAVAVSPSGTAAGR